MSDLNVERGIFILYVLFELLFIWMSTKLFYAELNPEFCVFVELLYLCNWTKWASEDVVVAVLEEEVAEVGDWVVSSFGIYSQL